MPFSNNKFQLIINSKKTCFFTFGRKISLDIIVLAIYGSECCVQLTLLYTAGRKYYKNIQMIKLPCFTLKFGRVAFLHCSLRHLS